jgi:hypothetical protein
LIGIDNCVTRAREDTRGGKGKFGAERLGENAFKMADKHFDLHFCLDNDTEDGQYKQVNILKFKLLF